MTVESSTRKVTTAVGGTAVLFAAVFWLLDAGSEILMSNAGLSSAVLPPGDAFVSRMLLALVFGAGGAIAGAAWERSRAIESFAIESLRDGHRRYQALLASSFDSVMTLDRDGRIVEASESAVALFGYTAGNLAGRHIDDLVEPDGADGEEPASASVSALAGRGNGSGRESLAVTARTAGGRRFPAEIRATPVPGDADLACLVAVRETTSSIVAQKALRHSERRYQALFDNIPDGVYRSLPDGRLLAANPALVRMLGFDSADELLAEGDARALYADPADRKKLLAELERSGSARNVEVRLKRRDGSEIAVLANVRAVTSDNNGDAVFEGTLTDISDLLEAREALEDSEEHFRALCEQALDVINVIDESGAILYASPSSRVLTGRSPAEQVGLRLFRSVHPDDREAVLAMIAAGFERPGRPQRFTCRVYRHDGALRYLEAVGTAFMTRRGELRAVVHSRDVTGRLATEAQLREMQKVQVVGRLTDGLAHEFNNLLTVISGNLELLDETVDEPVLKTHVTSALGACRQGSDLTRRLLAFVEHKDARAENVSVNGLLLDMAPVLRRSLGESIRFETALADDLWDIRVDPVQLEAAVLHLAVNARDAMENGGTLRIATANLPGTAEDADAERLVVDCVCIRVDDTGIGMDEEVLARATDPFFSTSAARANTGLGLSAVKRFIEAAGGEIRIDSERGRGTSVELYLPAIGPTTGVDCEAAAVAGGSERVLVVDDNPAVRRATAGLLRSLGYRVEEAGGGHAALRELRCGTFDLLLTDIAMPDLSGCELAERARALCPETRVLLASGNEAAVADAADSGFSSYELIRKPFRKEGLARQVRQLLDQ